MNNCFVKMKKTTADCSQGEGRLWLQIVVSDPHVKMMFEERQLDTEAVVDLIHTVLVGRPPVTLSDKTKILDERVKNSGYWVLLQQLQSMAAERYRSEN